MIIDSEIHQVPDDTDNMISRMQTEHFAFVHQLTSWIVSDAQCIGRVAPQQLLHQTALRWLNYTSIQSLHIVERELARRPNEPVHHQHAIAQNAAQRQRRKQLAVRKGKREKGMFSNKHCRTRNKCLVKLYSKRQKTIRKPAGRHRTPPHYTLPDIRAQSHHVRSNLSPRDYRDSDAPRAGASISAPAESASPVQ